ncbi:MAG: anthranilate synthase component I [Flavobacteriales bacterium]|nr:MAG: anthranilate synthase component I [Flavobacteriales bacterium]
MKKFKLYTTHEKILADTITPVSIYLKVRDKYPNSILLESSDYHSNENSFSYICFKPIASITVDKEQITEKFPDGSAVKTAVKEANIIQRLSDFANSFESDENGFDFINNGLFGYIGYDSVRYFEDIDIRKVDEDDVIPDIIYSVYQYVIAINHFKNEAYIFSHSMNEAENDLSEIEGLVRSKNFASYHFTANNREESNFTDKQFLERIELAKKHCHRGDVFQLVLSRRFWKNFQGDDFNVYRALRSINPSPYLFYFDYGSFKIFGSSPEAQLVVKGNRVEIHPIAGTFRRTGNDEEDLKLAHKLTEDAKENAEHVMLVDLARNDLARNGHNVKVETYKEVQYYSHVIHLVSKVIAEKSSDADTLQLVADTFPAGTLSGAPKYKAMELIEQYENDNRSYYGGCIGFMGFSGDFNHAIMIRTFCCRDNKLYYQAGAGIVAESKTENELQEVYNKIEALRKAMEIAQQLGRRDVSEYI